MIPEAQGVENGLSCGFKFNGGKLKALTGQDGQSGRKLYHDTKNVPIGFKLVMHSNMMPVVDSGDTAATNRLHVAPFGSMFPAGLKEADPFAGMTAFDLMAYEEVGCRDHLRASPWNILLQVGDTLHAYDRRVLDRMMREKEIVARGHHFFTTPHHQSVEEGIFMYLRASDYSVVELVHAYDATLDAASHVTSVYHVNFYSVEGWQHGDSGITVSAPLKADVVEAPVEPYQVDAALDAVLAGPAAASSAARYEAMMDLYRSAEEELEEQRVLMAELAERLSREMSYDSHSHSPPQE